MAKNNLEAENQHLRSLVAWIGQHIQTINVNGRRSDKFCLICKKTTVRGPQCRHREIWEVMAEEYRKVADPQQSLHAGHEA